MPRAATPNNAGATPAATPPTIVGLASAPGAGHRAIVRLSGCRAFALVDLALEDGHRDIGPGPRRGAPHAVDGWFRPDRGPPIPCACWRFPAPRSYTGEDACELHVGGGALAVRRILESLLDAGAVPAGPGDFTRRAFEAGRLDLSQVEAVLALADAGDEGRARAALAGLDGGLARALEAVEAPLVLAASLLAAALDFADRDLGTELERRAAGAVDAALDACRAVDREVGAEAQRRESAGGDEASRGATALELPRAVLVGAPNAGKSSLFNALLGHARAATDAQPGTTRDPVVVRVTLGGVALELVDLAGLGEPTMALDAAAMERARAWVAGADLAIALAPPEAPWPAPDVLAGAGAVLRVRSQVDRARSRAAEDSGVVATSARDGTGVAELASRLGAALAERPRPSAVFVSARARAALRAVRSALERARDLLAPASPATELAHFELGEARYELGRVGGRIGAEDLLDAIFAQFCIGK